MTQPRVLEDALATRAVTFYCITPDGAEVAPVPPELASVSATYREPSGTLDSFDPTSYGTVISAFLAASTDGYGTTTATMVGGEANQVEIFAGVGNLGCTVVCMSPTDSHVEDEAAPPMDLPARRMTSRMDLAGRNLFIDEGITRILGWTPEEYAGLSTLDKVHPDDRHRAISAFAELLGRPEGQTRTRQRVRHKNGTWRWFEVTHTNMSHAPEPHMVVESYDISDEMQVTLELQERETLLRLLTENLPFGVFHLGRDGRPDLSNDGWVRMTGTTNGSGLEEFLNGLVNGAEVGALVDQARADGLASTAAVTFVADDAICRHADLEIRPLAADAPPFSVLLTLVDTSESVAIQAALHRQSRQDHLTGVLNRLGLEEQITMLLTDQRVDKLTVLYCDLNSFKSINDTLGHAAGDDVLEAVAMDLARELRSNDVVGRWGGDEFLVALPDLSAADVNKVVQRIENRVEQRADLLAEGVGVSMSIGQADAEPGDTLDTLLRRADAAMYKHKTQQADRQRHKV